MVTSIWLRHTVENVAQIHIQLSCQIYRTSMTEISVKKIQEITETMCLHVTMVIFLALTLALIVYGKTELFFCIYLSTNKMSEIFLKYNWRTDLAHGRCRIMVDIFLIVQYYSIANLKKNL